MRAPFSATPVDSSARAIEGEEKQNTTLTQLAKKQYHLKAPLKGMGANQVLCKIIAVVLMTWLNHPHRHIAGEALRHEPLN